MTSPDITESSTVEMVSDNTTTRAFGDTCEEVGHTTATGEENVPSEVVVTTTPAEPQHEEGPPQTITIETSSAPHSRIWDYLQPSVHSPSQASPRRKGLPDWKKKLEELVRPSKPRPTVPKEVPPPLPSGVNQQEVLSSLGNWVREEENSVEKYRTQVDQWLHEESRKYKDDVEELRRKIQILNRQVEERKEAATRVIEPILKEANDWIEKQENRLEEARLTMEILRKNNDFSETSPLTPTEGLNKSPKGPPKELLCPITLELMQDPVIAVDGHTYERAAIQQVFDRSSDHPVSPCTNLPLQSQQLIPNVGIRSMCRRWQQSVGFNKS